MSSLQEEKKEAYTLDALYPIYQDFISTLQSRLKSSFQKYGVHENTLKEFMYAWELQVRKELNIANEDTRACELEIDMLLEEFDDLIDFVDGDGGGSTPQPQNWNSSGMNMRNRNQINNFQINQNSMGPRTTGNGPFIQLDGETEDVILDNVKNEPISYESSDHNELKEYISSAQELPLNIRENINVDEKLHSNKMFLQVDGADDTDAFQIGASFQDFGNESFLSIQYQMEDGFDVEKYRAPVDETDFQDVLICQYSDIKNEKGKSTKKGIFPFNMDLLRGILYCGGRDYIFWKAKAAANFKLSEKKVVTTRTGAYISTLSLTAQTQHKGEDSNLNMNELTQRIQNAEYDPQKFGGHHIQMRRDNPRCLVKIFRTGTISVTGCSDIKDARTAIFRAAALLEYLGVEDASIKSLKIGNIDATYDYGHELNLKYIVSFRKGDFVEENMEESSTVAYSMNNPTVKIKISKSGTLRLVDTKSIDDVDRCIEILVPYLDEVVNKMQQDQQAKRGALMAKTIHQPYHMEQLQTQPNYPQQPSQIPNISSIPVGISMYNNQQYPQPMYGSVKMYDNYNTQGTPIYNNQSYLNNTQNTTGDNTSENTKNQSNTDNSQWRSFQKDIDF